MKRGAASSGSEHPDPYNYSRLYGEDGLKRKRDGEDEEIALFHVRTPKYRRVSRVSEVRGAKNGGVVDADRRRLIDEQWAAWRRKRSEKPAQGLGAKEEPPAPADKRNIFQKVWDNPYGKVAIVTAGTGLLGFGLDTAMSKSRRLSSAVERGGQKIQSSRLTKGFNWPNYPTAEGVFNRASSGTRGAIRSFGGGLEHIGGTHVRNIDARLARNTTTVARLPVGRRWQAGPIYTASTGRWSGGW